MSTAEPLLALEVRDMEPTDLEAVLRIERTAFSTPWSRVSFGTLLSRGDTNLWVALADGEIVAYAVVWYVAGEAELGNLAVARGWRRRGVGRRMLDWALARARERGARRIFLEVRLSNRAAQALYERRGFVQVGLRRRYYRAPTEDARVLCLDLGPSS